MYSRVYGRVSQGVRQCTAGEQVVHGTVRGPPLAAVAEGLSPGSVSVMRLREPTLARETPTGDQQMDL